MRNEKLRQKKIARNKKRRFQRRKSCLTEPVKDRKIRVHSFFKAGSRHGARKIRKDIYNKISEMILKKIKFKLEDIWKTK